LSIDYKIIDDEKWIWLIKAAHILRLSKDMTITLAFRRNVRRRKIDKELYLSDDDFQNAFKINLTIYDNPKEWINYDRICKKCRCSKRAIRYYTKKTGTEVKIYKKRAYVRLEVFEAFKKTRKFPLTYFPRHV
jgi:hypothetical protein